MNNGIKAIIVTLMAVALAAGYLTGVVDTGSYKPERLHIFLFNLCSGGTILIYYSERLFVMSVRVWTFLIVSVCYAFFAFFELYPATIACSVVLAVIVEYVREKRYPVFPFDFFSSEVPVSEKFNHASLLCLFIGLIISSLVIVNNQYLNYISVENLDLDTFFLGFSFPLSLISMSVMFHLMEKQNFFKAAPAIKNACFWAVNLGVIIFFGFILLKMIVPQVIVTTILFIAVIAIFIIFIKSVYGIQQKTFLVSGMLFLVYTSVTGILYIVLHFFPDVYDQTSKLVIKLHALSALYGWNLSGLAVISRLNNFPLRFNSCAMIAVHWCIVAILVPLGYYNILVAFFAVPAYFIFLLILFFSSEKPIRRDHAED